MEGRLPSRKKHKGEYHPAGRLVPVFLASEAQGQSELALSLGRKAASFGETVLMLDCQNGSMMDAAGIIYHKTIYDVLNNGADLDDVKYVTSIFRELPLVRLIWIQLWEVLQLYLYFMIGCLWSRQWAVRRLMSA